MTKHINNNIILYAAKAITVCKAYCGAKIKEVQFLTKKLKSLIDIY